MKYQGIEKRKARKRPTDVQGLMFRFNRFPPHTTTGLGHCQVTTTQPEYANLILNEFDNNRRYSICTGCSINIFVYKQSESISETVKINEDYQIAENQNEIGQQFNI
ncbi:Hypothetical_protein [Hexamita inflata]|uniref:Hypothetical_protein n=1 Tax=Hexamita inflata TaxID=28002 RepID=A0AA86NVJ0_9EUKA|nr:Hypothetical protein HINF_LOCUS13850 [Hexamita inflata]CAI9926208.1 Hypothetical protein HINF_LOCUS13853 [Hexamita inflata]